MTEHEANMNMECIETLELYPENPYYQARLKHLYEMHQLRDSFFILNISAHEPGVYATLLQMHMGADA